MVALRPVADFLTVGLLADGVLSCVVGGWLDFTSAVGDTVGFLVLTFFVVRDGRFAMMYYFLGSRP